MLLHTPVRERISIIQFDVYVILGIHVVVSPRHKYMIVVFPSSKTIGMRDTVGVRLFELDYFEFLVIFK